MMQTWTWHLCIRQGPSTSVQDVHCPLISDPQVVVPVLLGLAATGFLLDTAILASILSSRLLLRTRDQDK